MLPPDQCGERFGRTDSDAGIASAYWTAAAGSFSPSGKRCRSSSIKAASTCSACGTVSRAKSLNEGSSQYLFGFQLVACHVKGQGEDAMAMAVVHVSLCVHLLQCDLAGRYYLDWVTMNDRFEFEQVRLCTQCISIDYFGKPGNCELKFHTLLNFNDVIPLEA